MNFRKLTILFVATIIAIPLANCGMMNKIKTVIKSTKLYNAIRVNDVPKRTVITFGTSFQKDDKYLHFFGDVHDDLQKKNPHLLQSNNNNQRKQLFRTVDRLGKDNIHMITEDITYYTGKSSTMELVLTDIFAQEHAGKNPMHITRECLKRSIPVYNAECRHINQIPGLTLASISNGLWKHTSEVTQFQDGPALDTFYKKALNQTSLQALSFLENQEDERLTVSEFCKKHAICPQVFTGLFGRDLVDARALHAWYINKHIRHTLFLTGYGHTVTMIPAIVAADWKPVNPAQKIMPVTEFLQSEYANPYKPLDIEEYMHKTVKYNVQQS